MKCQNDALPFEHFLMSLPQASAEAIFEISREIATANATVASRRRIEADNERVFERFHIGRLTNGEKHWNAKPVIQQHYRLLRSAFYPPITERIFVRVEITQSIEAPKGIAIQIARISDESTVMGSANSSAASLQPNRRRFRYGNSLLPLKRSHVSWLLSSNCDACIK